MSTEYWDLSTESRGLSPESYTEYNRKHCSKSLVKRSCVGLAEVWGQKTQPQRGISRFIRPKPSYFTNPFLTQRNSKTIGFYVVPRFPSLFGTTRGSRGQKSHENAVRNHLAKAPSRQLRDRSAQGPWLGGRSSGAQPPLDPATEPLKEVVLGRRGACWLSCLEI